MYVSTLFRLLQYIIMCMQMSLMKAKKLQKIDGSAHHCVNKKTRFEIPTIVNDLILI